MIFVTDDHRTIRLAQKNKESRGVIPELDETLMKSLMAEMPERLKPGVRVAVERRMTDAIKKY